MRTHPSCFAVVGSRGRRELDRGPVDAGFTLIEVLISLALIGIAAAALGTFFAAMISATSGQSGKQTAVQVADSLIEQARALKGSAVTAGRDQQSTRAQWSLGESSPTVAPYLDDMTLAWDDGVSYPSGESAALPTTPTVTTINGIEYSLNWYVGVCWRPPGDDNACLSGSVAGATRFFKVVGAVTWSDKSCPDSACSYVTATLINSVLSEPVFANAGGPTPAPPTGPAGPTGGSVDATGLTGTGGRYSASTTLHLALDKGTAAAGLASAGARLYRASAPLTSAAGTANGSCGSYGMYGQVGADDPPAALADPVADNTCYRYKYVVADTLGNTATYTSGDVKVDTTAPTAPTLTFQAVSNAYVSGTTVFYRPGVSGSFTATASGSTDPASGISSYTFPDLGTGWTATPGGIGVTTYSWTGTPAMPGAQTVTAVNNAGAASPTSGFTVDVDSTGPSGGYVDATGLTGTGGRYSTSTTLRVAFDKGTDPHDVAPTGATVLRLAAPLTATGGTADGACGSYDPTPVQVDDPISPMFDTVPDQACYQYRYTVTDSLGNPTTYTSGDIKVDTTPPAAPTLSFTAMTNSYQSAGTVYITPGANSGSFTVTATAADSASGIASYNFPSLGGGWTATPGGDGVMTYSWSAANPAPSNADAVTATDNASLTSTAGTFAVVTDSTGPTGGSVDASGLTGTGGRYSSSTTLSIVLDKGTDPSGLAATGATLTRATAPLTASGGTANGTCGAYGSYTLVTGGTDPASPKNDTVADQTCYRYQYTVSDTLGNPTTYTSGDIKVDTTAPATPGLVYSAMTNVYAAGNTVYYRSTAPSGSFTVTASSTDTASGIASYAFPSLGTGWTSAPGSLGINTYSWSSAGPAASGPTTVTATNNAFVMSAATTFTPTADTTAPTGASVSYLNGYATSTSVPVTFSAADGGSGVSTAAGVLQRASATLSNGSCGTFGSYGTVATGPTSPYNDTTVTTGNCYMYQYIAADNVGNTAAAANSLNVVKVATTGPSAPSLLYSAMTNTYAVGNTVYYRSTAASGSFTVTATSTETTSGIASYAFPSLGTGWVSTPGSLGVNTYSWSSAGPAAPGAKAITATSNAGATSPTTTFTPTADNTAPTGSSVSYANGYVTTLSVPVTFSAGSDTGSGVDTTATLLQRSSATLSGGSCGAFGSYSTVATGPTSPYSDTTVTSGTCYKYQVVSVDNVGNTATPATSANVVKVATTGPSAPSLAYSAMTNTYAAGNTVYYRSTAASGSFTVTATSTDTTSGIASYAFPALGTGWASAAGALGVNTYSWSSAGPAAPGAKTVTATNNAGATSPTTTFTPTADTTAPTGASVSYPNGYTTSSSVPVTFSGGSDTGSGVSTAGGVLQRASATLSGSSCGAFGSYTTIATGPTSPYNDTTVTTGNCYKYQYIAADNVGNTASAATSTNAVQFNWYNAAWSYRKLITLTPAQISGTNTNFPVLLNTTDTGLKTNALANGNDIMFTAADGVTKLDHELGSYTSSTGALIAWVRMPTLSSTTNTMYMYYGNPSATSQQNPTGAWNSNFRGVWHLDEAPTATAPQFNDPTTYNNNGTNRGSIPAANQVAGKIGGSINLNPTSTNQYISSANSVPSAQLSAFTISAWVKTTTKSGKKIFGYENAQTGESSRSSSSTDYDRQLWIDTNGYAHFGVFDTTGNSGNGTNTSVTYSTNIADGAWHFLEGTYSTASGTLTFYVDGVSRGTAANTHPESSDSGGYWRIGSFLSWTDSTSKGVDGYFPGTVDEVRVSDVVRASGWAITEYANQENPASFATFGTEQS